MTSFFLVPEATVTQQGGGEAMPVQPASMLITLGILSVEEQESLHVAVWQSFDGVSWGTKPVSQFSQKFYPGTHQIVAQVTGTYVQARWHVNRWGRGDLKPRFSFYVFAESLTASSA